MLTLAHILKSCRDIDNYWYILFFLGRILSIAWHPTEDLIVTGGVDNIRIWSINSGHAIQRLTLGRQERNKETIVWCVAVTRYE